MVLEVAVAGEQDKETQLQVKSKPIVLNLIDTNNKTVVQTHAIHKNRLVWLEELAVGLYEVRVGLQKEDDGRVPTKIVTLHAAILKSRRSAHNTQWLRQYLTKISSLYDQGAMIFLDSLEGWSEVEASSKKYLEHQERWKLYSLVELIVLVIFSIGELVYLRRLLHSDVVLI